MKDSFSYSFIACVAGVIVGAGGKQQVAKPRGEWGG